MLADMNYPVPQLYTFRRCPFAIRARFTLSYADIEWVPIEVDLKAKPARLLELSPKGTVPVLVLDDGTVIEESYDIMRWAVALNDPGYFYRAADRATIDEWVRRNDEEFKPLLDGYKYPEGKPHSQEEYRMQGLLWLEELGLKIHYGRILGRPSLADIALFPFVRQFRGVDSAWFDQHAPDRVQDWLDSYVSSEVFSEIMEKD